MNRALLPVAALFASACGGTLQTIERTSVDPTVVRLRTPAGDFVTREKNAEDLARLLAGEPTENRYFAGK